MRGKSWRSSSKLGDELAKPKHIDIMAKRASSSANVLLSIVDLAAEEVIARVSRVVRDADLSSMAVPKSKIAASMASSRF